MGTSPNWATGYVPTAAEWNSSFTAKADQANGTLTTPTITGGTITGSAISAGTASGVAISGGTVASSAITGGTVAGSAITGGTIDSAVIGGTTPAAGAFTTLSATGTTSLLSGTGRDLTIADGTTRALLTVGNPATNTIAFGSRIALQNSTNPANAAEFALTGWNGNTIALTGSQSYSLVAGSTILSGTTTGAPVAYTLTSGSGLNVSGSSTGYTNFKSQLGIRSGASGNHVATLNYAILNQSGTTNATLGAANAWVEADQNTGGTTTTGTTAIGRMFAMNPQVWLRPGGTYWQEMSGGEFNTILEGTKQTATITGSATNADTVSLTFTSASITGSPVTVSATVGTSNPMSTVAKKLGAAINANSALLDAGVSGMVREGAGAILTITWPFPTSVTVSSSVTGAATEVVTLSSVTSGASVASKKLAQFIGTEADTVRGASGVDAMIFLGRQNGPPGSQFNYGVRFGGEVGQWPIERNGSIIAASPQQSIGGSGAVSQQLPVRAKYGIDFSKVNFSQATGQSLFLPAHSVSGTGVISVGAATINPLATGMSIDANGSQVTAAAVSAGGGGGAGATTANYFIGDIVTDAYGGQYSVTAVNSSTGAVTTVSILVASSITSGSTPANPVATTGGSGTGLTLTLTWGSATVLALQTSGGATTVGGQLTSRGIITAKQAAPTALTTSATLTGAQVLVGILTANQGAAGAAVYTLPTATAFQTALEATVATANDDAFTFSLVNISTNVLEIATIAANTGWTLVGGMEVQANSTVTAKSAGQFRARRTASNTYTLYRLS